MTIVAVWPNVMKVAASGPNWGDNGPVFLLAAIFKRAVIFY